MTIRTAVMTGGTSGLGRHAAHRLAQSCETLVLGTRGAGRGDVGRAIRLDLADLGSVRQFCAEVLSTCGARKIDLLVLNAGGSFPHEKTADGIEKNFAINHLAHYLILRSLMPALAENGRVVITTSGTHDPEEGTVVPPPKHADARRLAYPETDPELDPKPSVAAGRAYSSAKLCNLLTAQALARQAQIRKKQIEVIAYSPGPTPGTGLVSARGFVLGVVFRYILPIVAGLSSKWNTPEAAGSALANIALGELEVPQGRIYALLKGGKVTFPDPSTLARDETAIARMWEDSAGLLDFAPTEDPA